MMGMAPKFSPPPGASSGSGKGWIKKRQLGHERGLTKYI